MVRQSFVGNTLTMLLAVGVYGWVIQPATAFDKVAPRTLPHPIPSSSATLVNDVDKPKRPHAPSPCDPKDFPTSEAVAMCWANLGGAATPRQK